MKDRIDWLDALRGFGIISVIILHSTGNQTVTSFFKSFALPIFFFVSGFTFCKSRYAGWVDFFLKRLKTRILLYVIWVAIFYLFVMVENSRSMEEYMAYLMNLTRFEFLAGFIVGDFDWLKATIHNSPLWFLPCLFLIENMFYFVRNVSSAIQIALILVVFSFSAQFLVFSTALSIPSIVTMATANMLFYGSGFIANKINVINKINTTKIDILLLGVSLGVLSIWGVTSLEYPPGIKFPFEIFFYRIMTAFAGIISFTVFAKHAESWNWLRYLGTNTLIIFLLNVPLVRASCDIFFLVNFDFFDNIFKLHREVFTLLQVITILLLSIPCIFIINNYLPFLIGKKYKTRLE